MPAILNTTDSTQGCTTSRPCTWDKSVPFSWQANMAQNAAQVMYYLNKYHDHLASSPYGFTAAAGNFEGTDRVLGQAMDGANSDNGLPDKFHFNNANMGTPPDGETPTMQMYLFRAQQGSRCRAWTAETTPRSSTASTRTACPTGWSCIRTARRVCRTSRAHRWAKGGATGTPRTS